MATALPYQDRIKFPSTGAIKADTIRLQFGGGYTQRIAKGYNNVVGTYSVTWTELTTAEMVSMHAVFVNAKGVLLFSWVPPAAGTTQNFSISEMNYTQIAQNYYEYTATLVQEFDPS
ncbi:MAG: hypothetical protein EOO77_46140 [Oxalobacteraceae bacterium]|nr:MAG: hypothetical protein EOO77_46140 [Oxalobacteraceae bacterium]